MASKYALSHEFLRREVILRVSNRPHSRHVKTAKNRVLLACTSLMHIFPSKASNHATHVHGIAGHLRVEHGLNVIELLLMVSKISIHGPYLLFLLYYDRLLAVILPLKVILHLAHYLRMLQDSLLLHV